jgi:hypothetical protein
MPGKLTGRQLYDRRDPTRAEMLLVRAIHHLWLNRSKLATTGSEERALEEAFETLFQAKRQVKAEFKALQAQSFKQWKERRDARR